MLENSFKSGITLEMPFSLAPPTKFYTSRGLLSFTAELSRQLWQY